MNWRIRRLKDGTWAAWVRPPDQRRGGKMLGPFSTADEAREAARSAK